jgi:subtilisin family serine protease
VGNPITAPFVKYNKKDALVEYEKRFWHLMDLRSDSIAGMSVDRAHDELIKDLKGETVIVAVIDSGVDIDHPELKEAIWVNDDEIPNNRIDDDQNGYVDDVHGWNFLGDSELENMESVRLQRKETPGSEAFEKFEKDRLKNIQSKKEELASIENMIQKYHESDSIIKLVLGKEKYSLQEVEDFSPKTFALMEAIIFTRFLNENQLTKSKLEVYLKGAQSGIDGHYNIDFDGRAIVGDDPDDFEDQGYGNGNVIGPKKDGANHGTHVSGIIAADRGNDKGQQRSF